MFSSPDGHMSKRQVNEHLIFRTEYKLCMDTLNSYVLVIDTFWRTSRSGPKCKGRKSLGWRKNLVFDEKWNKGSINLPKKEEDDLTVERLPFSTNRVNREMKIVCHVFEHPQATKVKLSVTVLKDVINNNITSSQLYKRGPRTWRLEDIGRLVYVVDRLTKRK